MMDREHDPQPRAHSPTWPPGVLVGAPRSLMLERGVYGLRDAAGFLRAHGRAGTSLIALAVCAFSVGYGLIDWSCSLERRDGHSEAWRDTPVVGAVAAASQAAELADVQRQRNPRPQSAPSSIEPARTGSAPAPVLAGHTAPVANASLPPQQTTARAAAKRAVRSLPTGLVMPSTEEAPAAAVDAPGELEQVSLMPDSPEPARDDARLPPAVAQAGTTAEPLSKPAASQLTAALRHEHSAHPAHPAPRRLAAIESLSVEGALTPSVVGREVSRLLPQYERCCAYCDTAPQRLKLSAAIDEAGHGRGVVVEGLSRPELRRCLEQVTAHLSVRAPDTGTARARWIVRFVSGER